MCGALCVMTPGEALMPLWCVDNWATQLQVSSKHFISFKNCDKRYLSTDAVAFSRAHFGAGTGTIYLDNVGCSGSEANLIDCSSSSSVSCSSGHSEDAGVRCQGIEHYNEYKVNSNHLYPLKT